MSTSQLSRKFFFFAYGIFLGLTLLCSCQQDSASSSISTQIKGEYIYRQHSDHFFQLEAPQFVKREAYPWEQGTAGGYPKITKEFFRCRGSNMNPVHCVQQGQELARFYDCGGPQRHSLPLREQKEFIYPILIDLLNYLQNTTKKRVVITCGHCCPDHNVYLDASPANQVSKHLIGAEVDFYIQGMEHEPEKIVELILAYYRETPKYKGLKEFEEFKRYEKGDTKVRTQPWYNKEVFVKIFHKDEGRDFDNRHPYPYLSIQVRYDWDLKEQVQYSWDKAFRNFHRW